MSDPKRYDENGRSDPETPGPIGPEAVGPEPVGPAAAGPVAGPGAVRTEPLDRDEGPMHPRPAAGPVTPDAGRPHDGSGVELKPNQARQGQTLGRTRYVLAGSLFAIVLIFLVIWLVIARL